MKPASLRFKSKTAGSRANKHVLRVIRELTQLLSEAKQRDLMTACACFLLLVMMTPIQSIAVGLSLRVFTTSLRHQVVQISSKHVLYSLTNLVHIARACER